MPKEIWSERRHKGTSRKQTPEHLLSTTGLQGHLEQGMPPRGIPDELKRHACAGGNLGIACLRSTLTDPSFKLTHHSEPSQDVVSRVAAIRPRLLAAELQLRARHFKDSSARA